MTTETSTPTPPRGDARTIGTPIGVGLADDPRCRELALALDWSLSPETLRQLDAIDENIRVAHRLARTIRLD